MILRNVIIRAYVDISLCFKQRLRVTRETWLVTLKNNLSATLNLEILSASFQYSGEFTVYEIQKKKKIDTPSKFTDLNST